MSDQGDGTRKIKIGKSTVGYLYPEVYFRFVSLLHREHDDLLSAMVLARVKLEDGSALDFLNLMLGTTVTRQTPMELGYAQLYDALKMRRTTELTRANTERVAKEFFSALTTSPRSPEHQGKPLFPTWEEEDERDKRGH